MREGEREKLRGKRETVRHTQTKCQKGLKIERRGGKNRKARRR